MTGGIGRDTHRNTVEEKLSPTYSYLIITADFQRNLSARGDAVSVVTLTVALSSNSAMIALLRLVDRAAAANGRTPKTVINN